MKKVILIIWGLILTYNSITFAYEMMSDGVMSLGNGSEIVRISVTPNSNDTSASDMKKRIDRLERAVRDLQNQVYEISESATILPQQQQKKYICRTYTCRKSFSILAKDSDSCTANKLWNADEIAVKAFTRFEAEYELLPIEIKKDVDIVAFSKEIVGCVPEGRDY